MPNALVPIALALYLPAAYWTIRSRGPTRGVAAALLGGWLFLPVFDRRFDVPLLTTKAAFTPTVVLLASLAADASHRWRRLELNRADALAAIVCLAPFATALANGLGAYEGASASVDAFGTWGAPYLLGRIYFGSARSLRGFARALVAAALVYAPLCLWEIRMSPQLHRQVYGYHLFESFGFAVRWGGYRPSVFMKGLMLGTFMASGTLVAYWLWRSRAAARIAGIPIGWCAAILGGTTILVKSTGAVLLLAVGIGTLELTRRLRVRLLLLAITVLPVAFVAARIAGWEAAEVPRAASVISAERADSVAFRLSQEAALLERALDRPGLGWGRWGRSRIRDDEGRDRSVTDSLWIISLGTGGVVGLTSLGLLLLVPPLLLVRRFSARSWGQPSLAPAAALAIVVVLFVVDCLLNAMVSPVFVVICGGTVTFVAGRGSRARRRATAVPAEERLPPAFSAS